MESRFETEPLVERIRAEFREMPDLRVTVGELTSDGFLHDRSDGHYMRSGSIRS